MFAPVDVMEDADNPVGAFGLVVPETLATPEVPSSLVADNEISYVVLLESPERTYTEPLLSNTLVIGEPPEGVAVMLYVYTNCAGAVKDSVIDEVVMAERLNEVGVFGMDGLGFVLACITTGTEVPTGVVTVNATSYSVSGVRPSNKYVFILAN